jgi:glycosyltransferase involved in cell wall biosynthesis
LGGSDDELLERLAKLIARPELRCEMGRASRAHIERFDWDLITHRWAEIFVELASNPRSAAR